MQVMQLAGKAALDGESADVAVVVDKAQLLEPIHEMTYALTGCSASG